MKNIFKQIILVGAVIVILAGCEDVATNVKMPPAEKQIVVQCFIAPGDDTIKALVSWSKPVIGTSASADPEYINNARVEISNGVKTELLLWDNQSQLYRTVLGLFKIEAGKKYYLTVLLPDGKKVNANCEVPLTQNTTFTLTNIDTLSDIVGYRIITCAFNYKDHETSVKNYLRFDIKDSNDSEVNYYVSGVFKQDSELKSDNRIELTFYDNGQAGTTVNAKAWLINCDYNYYLYHKTLQGAQDNFGFFSEPSIVFSNIEGGIGCFGAYYPFEVRIKL